MSAALQAATASNARILSSLKSPLHVVVVGGTSGIGRAIAISIGRHCPSAHVTIIGRNESAAQEILPQLGSNSKFIRADVSLMSEIRTTTKKINAVDMLILTQGIFTMAGRTPTTENIDNKMALHYYGRVLFVQELLPLLRSSQNGGKVLFVLDSVRGNPSKINWNDMSLENTYSLSGAANHAITFTDLVIQHLASQPENTNVTFTHAYPGFVRTPLLSSLPGWARIPLNCAMALGMGVNPEDCAEFMIHGMLGTDKGYRYVNDKGEPITKKKPAQEDMVQKTIHLYHLQSFLVITGEAERFDETGGYDHSLLDNNQVIEKSLATYVGNYARGKREYSTEQHRIRFQLEAVSSDTTANTILIGIISSGVTATDQYFDRTPSAYAWRTGSYEWENENVIVQNGDHHRVPKHKWPGAKTGDILESTIHCDQRTISIENQTREGKDSMEVDLQKSPLPWKFIVVFSTRPDRVRLL